MVEVQTGHPWKTIHFDNIFGPLVVCFHIIIVIIMINISLMIIIFSKLVLFEPKKKSTKISCSSYGVLMNMMWLIHAWKIVFIYFVKYLKDRWMWVSKLIGYWEGEGLVPKDRIDDLSADACSLLRALIKWSFVEVVEGALEELIHFRDFFGLIKILKCEA